MESLARARALTRERAGRWLSSTAGALRRSTTDRREKPACSHVVHDCAAVGPSRATEGETGGVARHEHYQSYSPRIRRAVYSFCFLFLIFMIAIAVIGHFPPDGDYVRPTTGNG
eukprot:scaffold180904_cov27-Tisochrysis_lutea.AAC.1